MTEDSALAALHNVFHLEASEFRKSPIVDDPSPSRLLQQKLQYQGEHHVVCCPTQCAAPLLGEGLNMLGIPYMVFFNEIGLLG